MTAPQQETPESLPAALPEEIQQSLLYPSPEQRAAASPSKAAGDDLFDRLLVGMTAAERRKNATRRRRRLTLLVLVLIGISAGVYYGGESVVQWTDQRLPQVSAWLHEKWESVRHSR